MSRVGGLALRVSGSGIGADYLCRRLCPLRGAWCQWGVVGDRERAEYAIARRRGCDVVDWLGIPGAGAGGLLTRQDKRALRLVADPWLGYDGPRALWAAYCAGRVWHVVGAGARARAAGRALGLYEETEAEYSARVHGGGGGHRRAGPRLPCKV
jgi:hypothetical protein